MEAVTGPEGLALLSESTLPQIPGRVRGAESLRFWRSLAMMAERDPNLLISMLIEKYNDEKEASLERERMLNRQFGE